MALIRAYPCYENRDAWDIDDLVDAVHDGAIENFIISMVPRKNELALGCFSMPLTKSVNNMAIHILVDLNDVEHDDKPWYKLRVQDQWDGFMPINTDIDSLQMVLAAIKNMTMPLYNVTKDDDINPIQYPFIDISEL